MKRLTLVVMIALASSVLCGCDLLNITQSTVIDNGGGTSPNDLPTGCIVSEVNVDSESGDSVKIGRTITFSAEPRSSSGARLPDPCLNGPVRAEAVGECTLANPGAAASLEGTEFYASAVGECKARISYGGKTGTSEAVEITP